MHLFHSNPIIQVIDGDTHEKTCLKCGALKYLEKRSALKYEKCMVSFKEIVSNFSLNKYNLWRCNVINSNYVKQKKSFRKRY